MTGGPIYLHVPGDEASLEALADALDKALLGELRDREEALRVASLNFEPSWGGQAAEAFFASTVELRSDIQSKVSDYVARVGEVIRAYAWRIKRAKNTFADYADAARRVGLVVQDEYILAPTRRNANDPNAPCLITDVPETEVISIHGSRIGLFSEIAQNVGIWHSEHQVWVADHFGPLMEAADDASGLAKLLEHFKVTEASIVSQAIGGANHGVTNKIAELAESVGKQTEKLEKFTNALKSGSYELVKAQEGATGRQVARGLMQIEQSLTNWSGAGSVLKAIGPAADVIATWEDVSDGESWGGLGAGAAGGFVGAEAGAKLGSRGGLVGTFAGSVLGAWIGSGSGNWLWDRDNGEYNPAIPLGTREAIMSWLTRPGVLSVDDPKLA